MERFFNILRKTLVGTIALIFAFVVTYTPQPYNNIPESQAFPVSVIGGPGSVADITTAVNTTAAAAKEISLDQIGFLLAKAMLSQMLQSLVTWINSGFKGSPAFIQDLDRFLLDVADEAAGEFIQGLGDIGSFICSPFRLDIQLALSLRYQRAREGNSIDSCTLSGVVGNIEDFFNGQVANENFWQQWIQVTSRPETYTPYGQFMAAEGQLNARITNARGQQLEIANWGNGFLSNEICEAIEGPSGQNQNCVISTPGRVIAEQLTVTLDSGRQQLVSADEINEVISALLGQIANQALMGAAGLLGLSGGSGYTAGGYGAGSYVDELARESTGRTGSFLQQNYNQTRDKLEVQREYNALAVQYIPRLQAIIAADTTALRFRGLSEAQVADLRSRAQISYDDAVIVRDTTTEHIARLEPLITEFETLQRELTASTTPPITPQRQQAIITRQAEIINDAASYPAYTVYRMRESSREWGSITGS